MERIKKIQEFIKKNGNKMTNTRMAEVLGEPQIIIGGNIAGLKRTGQIPLNDWLLTDVMRGEQPKRVSTKGRPRNIVSKFKNVNTECKNTARNHIINQVLTKTGKVLTLSGETLTTERMLLEHNPNGYTFDIAELNQRVMKRLLKKVIGSSLVNKINTLYRGLVEDVIKKAGRDEYAHLILDYCGTLERFHSDILKAVGNNIVQVGGSISVTLCRRSRITPFIESWASRRTDKSTSLNESAIDGFFHYVCDHPFVGSANYEVKLIHNYRQLDAKGNKKGSNMTLIILERTK